MRKNLPSIAWLVILLSSCASTSRNSHSSTELTSTTIAQVDLPADLKATPLTDLSRTEDRAFILTPGFYETELKTYCLQPGTPDPSPRDAYLQAPLSGYRKDIVETVLYNSRNKPDIEQRHVQLLLWSIVSRSNYDNLSPAVRSDASQLLTPKQIFELRGGVMGLVKTVSYNLPSGGHDDVKRLFELGSSSYEAFEKMAVLREPSKLKKADFKNDQWYKQQDKFYIRYFPISYQKVKVQVYVPEGTTDSTGKTPSGNYLVFDPTGLQVIPANSNAQRLGIGGPVLDIIRVVVAINNSSNNNQPPKRVPKEKKEAKDSKTITQD